MLVQGIQANNYNTSFRADARKVAYESLKAKRWRLLDAGFSGNYDKYVRARQDYAKEFIQNPGVVQSMRPVEDCFQVEFERVGVLKSLKNLLKIVVKDAFRKKSPEEKQMEEMAKAIRAKRATK